MSEREKSDERRISEMKPKDSLPLKSQTKVQNVEMNESTLEFCTRERKEGCVFVGC